MADLPVTPIADYGSMLGIVPQNVTSVMGATSGRELQQAQTQGAELQNQKTKLLLDSIADFNNNMTPAANDTGGAPAGADNSGLPGGQAPVTDATSTAANADGGGDTHTSLAAAGLDPDSVTAHAQQQYAVKDIYTQQEQRALAIAGHLEMLGVPNAVANVKAQHDARVHNQMAQAQLGASKAYDESYAVSTAPDGSALSTLQKIHPEAANAIDSLAKKNKWTPDQTDSFVRTYADEMGNAVHRYSGRDVDIGKDGIARDKETNQPILNGNPAGLSAEEHATLMAEATKPVTIKQGDHDIQVPTWQYAGAPSAQAYINRIAMRNKAAANAPPGTAPGGAGAAPAAPTAATGAPAARAATPAGAAAPQVTDPALRTALADNTYRTPLPPERTGVSMGPADIDAKKSFVSAKNDLLKETGFNAKVSGAALVYMNAAQAILDKGGVTTGLGAETITNVNRLARQMGLKGGLTADPSNNIVLVKNLVNAGLQNIKAIFGPKVTANEVFLNLNKANPNVDMPEEALRTLIHENSDIAKYDIATSHRAQAYVGSGTTPLNDPHRFDDWNQQYFPKEKAVQVAPDTTKTSTPPATTPKVVQHVDKSGKPIYYYEGNWHYKPKGNR
jgi:hypothetical protein